MEKSAEAFRTISEVSELLQTPAHVLRFWESRFSQVKPVKRAGGRRYYRPSDLALLGGIKRLLHDDGMTIRGVQKVLREHGVRHVAALSPVETGWQEAVAEARPEPAPTAPPPHVGDDAPLAPHWPDAPAPETAGAGDALLSDPDDLAAPIAAEAPMLVDADAAQGRAFARDEAPSPADDARVPAATLLRAMDALRARDKRAELTSVHRRLSALRDRVARADGGDQG